MFLSYWVLDDPAVAFTTLDSFGIAMSVPRIAVIAAAGKGLRLHPRSIHTAKVMIDAGGKKLLTRHIERLRDELRIAKIYIILGYLGDQIRNAYGDGSSLGVDIRYVENPDVDYGLGTALRILEHRITEPFVLVLGDELYLKSNQNALVNISVPYVAICAIYPTADHGLIRKNYSVTMENERIISLTEKPEEVQSEFAGCGTYVFTPEIFKDVHETLPSLRTGRLELTDIINHAAHRGAPVLPFVLSGEYVNVNTAEDLNTANFLCRTEAFDEQQISVIVPADNEAASIGYVVKDFLALVDEVIVMDNESDDGTALVARQAGATVHSRQLCGYGDALKKGMDAANGDILVLVEADATFRAKDLGKLLEYLKDADMVIGTRTTRQLIEQGANMIGILRFGNLVFGKLIEVLWWKFEPRFTDVGCTYRVIWRDAYLKIRDYLVCDDATFSPEMMIEVVRGHGRLIEVPVSYYRRRGGTSKHSGNLWQSILTGLRMLRIIVMKRLNLI